MLYLYHFILFITERLNNFCIYIWNHINVRNLLDQRNIFNEILYNLYISAIKNFIIKIHVSRPIARIFT